MTLLTTSVTYTVHKLYTSILPDKNGFGRPRNKQEILSEGKGPGVDPSKVDPKCISGRDYTEEFKFSFTNKIWGTKDR